MLFAWLSQMMRFPAVRSAIFGKEQGWFGRIGVWTGKNSLDCACLVQLTFHIFPQCFRVNLRANIEAKPDQQILRLEKRRNSRTGDIMECCDLRTTPISFAWSHAE